MALKDSAQHVSSSGFYDGSGGMKLYYRNWMPVNPKALLVFIHGAGEHSGVYTQIAESCISRQLAFIAPDLRGFGCSEGQRGHVNGFQEYLDDLDKLVHSLQSRFPALPLFLSGHSLGGLVTIRYLQEFSAKIQGIILSAPAMGLSVKMPSLLLKGVEWMSHLYPSRSVNIDHWTSRKWVFRFKNLEPLKLLFAKDDSSVLSDPFITIQYTLRWFTELLLHGRQAMKLGAKLQVPTLCLYCEHDPVINPVLIRQLYESINTTDKSCLVFAESHQHNPLSHEYQEQAIEKLFEWLSEHL